MFLIKQDLEKIFAGSGNLESELKISLSDELRRRWRRSWIKEVTIEAHFSWKIL